MLSGPYIGAYVRFHFRDLHTSKRQWDGRRYVVDHKQGNLCYLTEVLDAYGPLLQHARVDSVLLDTLNPLMQPEPSIRHRLWWS